jgi:hypothetical protein
MWIYILAYETPFPAPPAFERYLENLNGTRVLRDVWIVRGNLSAHALVASARAFLGDESRIFAAEANEDYSLHGIVDNIQTRHGGGGKPS